jgi:hypothetical protein
MLQEIRYRQVTLVAGMDELSHTHSPGKSGGKKIIQGVASLGHNREGGIYQMLCR